VWFADEKMSDLLPAEFLQNFQTFLEFAPGLPITTRPDISSGFARAFCPDSPRRRRIRFQRQAIQLMTYTSWPVIWAVCVVNEPNANGFLPDNHINPLRIVSLLRHMMVSRKGVKIWADFTDGFSLLSKTPLPRACAGFLGAPCRSRRVILTQGRQRRWVI
jgi:hypothetical protein